MINLEQTSTPRSLISKSEIEQIFLRPIGFVSSRVTRQTDEYWGKIFARIILYAEYRGGLSGLENFSHAIIVTYLHQAHFEPSKHLLRRPRDQEDIPEVGIFSQRSKDRPNPIGITSVEIIKVSRNHIEVKGLDAIDGTPIIDIKPYYPMFDKVDSAKVPEWVNRLMENYF